MKKGINDFNFGTLIGRFQSDGAGKRGSERVKVRNRSNDDIITRHVGPRQVGEAVIYLRRAESFHIKPMAFFFFFNLPLLKYFMIRD